MDHIVVTGATGRVGHLVVDELLALGCRVRAVGRTMEKLRPLAERGADARAGGPRAYEDRGFLASVFKGVSAAFVLTPVDVAAKDVNEIQYKVIDGLVSAIRDSNVKHVVLLSSWGAELETQVGGIIGCHRFEKLLDQVPGLNVVYLRPAWFMENFLWNIPLIKLAGINGLGFKPNVLFPTIATRDIAPIAAKYLATLDFQGRNVRYLNGARDYTMTEITRILGASIGRPHIKYVEFPDGVFRKGLLSAGLTPNAADFAIQSIEASTRVSSRRKLGPRRTLRRQRSKSSRRLRSLRHSTQRPNPDSVIASVDCSSARSSSLRVTAPSSGPSAFAWRRDQETQS